MKFGWLGYVLLLCCSWSAHAAEEEGTPLLFERADLAWKERRDEDTKLAFEALFAADPNHRLGHESFQHWQWGVAGDQSALSQYQQRLEKDPSPINHYLLGRLPSKAKERAFHLKSAVEKDPSNTAFAKEWGLFLFRQGRFDEALGVLETLQTALPKDSDVLSGIRGSLRLQKKLTAAEQRFVDPSLNDTDSFWKQWTAFSYYKTVGRLSQDQPFFQRCSALEPESLLILRFDFWNTLREEDVEKSRAILAKIQEQDPWGLGIQVAPLLPILIEKDLYASIALWEELIRVIPFETEGYARVGGRCAQVSQLERSKRLCEWRCFSSLPLQLR
jgi:tetratricopeptide (TPR) repeat protein